MAKVAAVLAKHKRDNDGRCPVYIRISDSSNRTKYVALDIAVRPSEWNPRTREVRKTHDRAEEHNGLIAARIGAVVSEIARLRIDGQPISLEHLQAVARGNDRVKTTDFFAFADRVVDTLGRQGRIHTRNRFCSVVNTLRTYTRGSLIFEAITPRFLSGGETYMQVAQPVFYRRSDRQVGGVLRRGA